MEDFLLASGFSWTVSKILPYVLMLLVGCGMAFLLNRFLKIKGFPRFIVLLTVVLIPFMMYFVFRPIYEGDFANKGKVQDLKAIDIDFQEDGLYMISIPNCPYCYESLDVLMKLDRRIGKNKIHMLVCSSDSSSTLWYENKVKGSIDIRLAIEKEKLSEISGGRFPSFILQEEDKIKIWSNSTFGVRALDEVERALK